MPKSNSENDSFTEPMDEVDLKDVSSTPVDTDGESIDPPASSREKIESSKSSDVESELLRLLIEDKMKEFEAFGQSPYPILYLYN